MRINTLRLVAMALMALALMACSGETVIPPCTPVEGVDTDPCEPLIAPLVDSSSLAMVYLPDGPSSIRDLLTKLPGHTAHLVVRGTYLPDSIRCTADGEGIRMQSWRTERSHWLFSSGTMVKCFADMRVNDYIVGSGPAELTVWVMYYLYGLSEHAAMGEQYRSEVERVVTEGGDFYEVEVVDGGIAGREVVVALKPAWDTRAAAWHVGPTWDIQRLGDGSIVAIHPQADHFFGESYRANRAALQMTLPALVTAMETAHAAHVTEHGGRIGEEADLPLLMDAADELPAYIAAQIPTPEAGSPPPKPPTAPPPACARAVEDAAANPGLMADCMTLLVSKDRLRGTGSLNWSTATAIGSWDGVTTAGTPLRVTKVDLDDEDLRGTIPAGLGSLFALTHLDLSDNTLTGDIPRELGGLDNLKELRLSGNSLTGCIPIGLMDVAINDLASLTLLYCRPPTPVAPVAWTAAETSVPLTWTSVANVSKYRVEYRVGGPGA